MKIISSKIRFIKDVINENIQIYKNKKINIIQSLKENDYIQVKDKKVIDKELEEKDNNTNNYDYLIKMSLYTFTEEEIDKLNDEHEKLKEKYDNLFNITIEKLWENECLELLKNLK